MVLAGKIASLKNYLQAKDAYSAHQVLYAESETPCTALRVAHMEGAAMLIHIPTANVKFRIENPLRTTEILTQTA